MRKTRLLCCLSWLFLLHYPGEAQVRLPGGNLGNTSFVDGLGFPGLVLDQFLQFYYADSFTDAHGHDMPGVNRMHNVLLLEQIKYVAPLKFLGAWPGVELGLPIMLDLHVKNERFDEHDTDFGDLIFGLMLQWPEITLFKQMRLYQRAELTLKFPTGHYDRKNYVNVGSHVYAINPYYAFTLFFNEKIEWSMRLMYAWHSKNNDPPDIPSPTSDLRQSGPPVMASHIQPGQAIWANYAFSYGITRSMRAGVNGYYLEQINNHRIDGHGIANSRERVFSVGPGLMLISPNQKELVWLNAYYEAIAKNRPKGGMFLARWLHVF